MCSRRGQTPPRPSIHRTSDGFGAWQSLHLQMTAPVATQPSPADLDAARRGDEAAFGRLLEPHRASLQAHCYRMLGSRADAEDAVQEALLRAWRGLPRFEGRSS